MKILIVYDGSLNAKNALRYAIQRVKDQGGEVLALSAFQKELFLDYEGGIAAVDAGRAEADRHVRDAHGIIDELGASDMARVILENGSLMDEALRYAAAEQADLIITPARYRSVAKSAPCPVYTIPGAILLPLDSSTSSHVPLESVSREAKALSSKVIVLGMVPVHLYSRWERKELEQVKRGTAAAVKKTKAALAALGVEASELIRAGYPDEEILKAAEEFSVSLIMIPAGGATPSELSKAASILLDEPQRVRMPVLVLPEARMA